MRKTHEFGPVPVLVVVGQLGIGGSERQLYLFLKACDQARWSPHVMTNSAGLFVDAIHGLGIKVELLQGSRLRRALAVRHRCAELGARSFVSWSSYTNPLAWVLLGLGVPAVGSYRNASFVDIQARHRQLWSRLGMARLNTIVTNSPETGAVLAGRTSGRVIVMPNAVERPSTSASDRARWRRRLSVTDDEVLVLGVGRLTEQKNFPRFIDAVTSAARCVPALRGVVIGPDCEGKAAELAAYARDREPRAGVITFHGPVPRAAEALCAADMLLLSSDHEGMPNVVLEAMACGVPCVVTRVNGVGSVIDDGCEGFIVAHEAEALAERLTRLALSPALRREMGDRARRRIDERFDPSAIYPPLWQALPLAPLGQPHGLTLRVLDVILTLLAAVPALALLAISAVLIKLDSPGPVLHRAPRVGRDGAVFDMLKLRSMYVRAHGGPGITARDDPRVTRVGRRLRRWKLDELPQVFNVLQGHMSLVGPRPEDPRYIDPMQPAQRTVLSVRPGLTSPASLKYRQEDERLPLQQPEQLYLEHLLPDKLAIDAAFVETLRPKTYLWMLLRTVWELPPRRRSSDLRHHERSWAMDRNGATPHVTGGASEGASAGLAWNEPDYAGALLRAWPALLLAVIVAAVTALGVSRLLLPATYQSSATVIVQPTAATGAEQPPRTFANDQSLGATFEELARQAAVTTVAAGSMNESQRVFLSHASVHSVPKTPLIELTYSAASAQQAARGAQTYADAFVGMTEATAGLPGLVSTVSKSSLPQSPTGRRTGLNMVVAALTGLVIAMALVCVRETWITRRRRDTAGGVAASNPRTGEYRDSFGAVGVPSSQHDEERRGIDEAGRRGGNRRTESPSGTAQDQLADVPFADEYAVAEAEVSEAPQVPVHR